MNTPHGWVSPPLQGAAHVSCGGPDQCHACGHEAYVALLAERKVVVELSSRLAMLQRRLVDAQLEMRDFAAARCEARGEMHSETALHQRRSNRVDAAIESERMVQEAVACARDIRSIAVANPDVPS